MNPNRIRVLVVDDHPVLREGVAVLVSKTHVKNILTKLGANDRTHAVTLALRRGIIRL
jgi:DNA-binding NarL/FixJ family response regulator